MWLKLIAWLKTSKWWLYALVAAAIAVALVVLRNLFTSPGDEGHGDYQLPEAPPVLKQAVEQAEEDALRTRVEAAAKNEAHKQQLQQVGAIEDGAERRKQLAALLNSM
jgi:predicted membrane-bound mannosyltransferase